MVKCIEASEATPTTDHAYPLFSMDLILFPFSQQHGRKMLSRDPIKKLVFVKSVISWGKLFEQTEFLPKDLNYYCGDL